MHADDQTVLVPPMSGRNMAVHAGNVVEIIDLEGCQVGDFWAIDAGDPTRWLSTVHTRDALERLFPRIGDHFVDQRYEPILRFLADTSPGRHDMLYPACNPALYARQGLPGHPNCADNFVQAATATGTAPSSVPDPVNLFQNSMPGPHGEITVRPAVSRPGDRVSLLALREAVVVLTACAVDFWPTNGDRCTALLLERRPRSTQPNSTPGCRAPERPT
jgi:uncharacterized protein YcgI (DUF1989 family)